MQQPDTKKYPETGEMCAQCRAKVTIQNQRDFATVVKKGNKNVYECYCFRCLNSMNPQLLQTDISSQQLTKHPEQFKSQIMKEIDYPSNEEQKTTNYYVSKMQNGYQLMCVEHDEVLNLWDNKNGRLACIKCARVDNSIQFGDNTFNFLDQEIGNVLNNINKVIGEYDRAIDHYKEQQNLIDQAKKEQRKRDVECKEEIKIFVEKDCKENINNYIQKKKAELGKLDSKIGQYCEEIETRARVLRDRGNSIKQFAANFREKNALYLQMEPMALFKEDINFWSNINQNWDPTKFNWSYRNPSFEFEGPEKVASDIFKIDYLKSQRDLKIVDFKH